MKKILLLVAFSVIFPAVASAAVCNGNECTGTLNSGFETGLSGGIGSNPAASVVSGTYHSAQTVTLSAPDASRILYTTNGTTPACTSTGNVYTTALSINADTTLKAVACYNFDYGVSSSVVTYTYAFTCTVTSVTHGDVAAYPGCAITCHTGYTSSGDLCIYAGGGGGGGGGGYIAPSTTTVPTTGMTIDQLLAEIARIQALIAQLQQQLLLMYGGGTSSNIPFLVDLQLGMANNSEVKRLQEFLISKGYLAAGYNTGNYYQLTANAVAAYQAAKGITPTNGRCGPLTRAAINADLGISF